MLGRCLGLPEYLDGALELLIQEGLLEVEAEDGDKVDADYEHYDDLKRAARKLVDELKDDPALRVKQDSWEWLEGYPTAGADAQQVAAEAEIKWFADLTLDKVTYGGDLWVYAQLKMIIGDHATAQSRIEKGSIFNTLVGGDQHGGQLAMAIKMHFYPPSQASTVMSAAFLSTRVVDFIIDSAWPRPYDGAFQELNEYAFDLMRRATWKTAPKHEWVSIVQNKLVRAMKVYLPTFENLFKECPRSARWRSKN